MTLLRRVLSGIFLAVSVSFVFLTVYLIFTGFPPPSWLSDFHVKDIRKPFEAFFIMAVLALWIHPERERKGAGIQNALAHPAAIRILLGGYFLLYLWHEVAFYYSLKIHCLPFSFYDYMLYYFFQGKVNFTSEHLHGFYHINNALYLLAPVWHFVKSPWVLVAAHPAVLVAAGIPLYALTRRFFPRPSIVPVVVVFVYLNYRYFQNLLDMNYSVENFYPLFVFSLFYFMSAGRKGGYWIFVFLTLSIKEDAPFYIAGLGFMQLWMKGKRGQGVWTMAVAGAYLYFIQKFFVVWTHNDILESSAKNFTVEGKTLGDVFTYWARHGGEVLASVFTPEVVRTLTRVFDRLLFIPLMTPQSFGVFLTLAPLMMQGGERFVEMRFHYAAPVIGFMFPALADGLRRLEGWLRKNPVAGMKRESAMNLVLILMVLINGGNFIVPKIDIEDSESLRLAKSVPKDAVLVTQCNLLPYTGYRRHNLYFQVHLLNPKHPSHALYEHADYYLLDKNVNAYPMVPAFVDHKVEELKARPDLELVHDDGIRFLFRKRTSHKPQGNRILIP